MTEPAVDGLRAQLRERGYLSHGIERWFALDPWRSRAFWVELAVVALKAAVLIGVFGALPYVAVMLARNHPLGPLETLELFLLYAAGNAVASFALVVVIALLLKLRPELPIDTPAALLGISIGGGGALAALFAVWWNGFDRDATTIELLAGLSLAALFFLVSTIVISAALLSFSIYELQRIPVIHQRPRTVPMSIAAAILIALLFVPAYGTPGSAPGEPVQIVTTPTNRRIALIAVDGLSWEIARSRAGLLEPFASIHSTDPIRGGSTTERWASLGTGVPPSLHRVRAVEGVKLPGGSHVLQSISHRDIVVRRIGSRQPLPPTVRERHYVWEIFAGRGVPVVAVNWWTTEEAEAIFASARGDALRVDQLAARLFLSRVRQSRAQFATVFLPSLDIVLNRLPADESARLAASIRVLDGIVAAITAIRSEGYDVVLTGMPGDAQRGHAVIAATLPIAAPRSTFDVAPTLCDVLGFPATEEMPGRSLAGGEGAPRIATFGSRRVREAAPALNQEYYESLKSLGYIR